MNQPSNEASAPSKWTRAAAAVIDGLLLALASFLIERLCEFVAGAEFGALIRAVIAISVFLVIDIIQNLRPGDGRGQSVGKQLCKIAAVPAVSNEPVLSLTQIILRTFLRWPAAISSVVLAFRMAPWHDNLVGSRVTSRLVA